MGKSKEELKFQELCDYVKKEIMGYDDNQKLSPYMCLRLRGMKDGKFIANKATTPMAHYSYDIILLTFKYIKPRLNTLLVGKKFTSDQHRFNYIMVVVSNNINTVYNKVKKLNEERRQIETIEVVDLPNYTNKYDKKNINKNLENFW